jgi:hypothetical protein
MTTKERLIHEISDVPEELLEELLDFLLIAQTRRNQIKPLKTPRPYALCAGEFSVPKNFNDPLPEDILVDFE